MLPEALFFSAVLFTIGVVGAVVLGRRRTQAEEEAAVNAR